MVVWGAAFVREIREFVVARAGVEPATFRVSVGRSYQLSYLAVADVPAAMNRGFPRIFGDPDRT